MMTTQFGTGIGVGHVVRMGESRVMHTSLFAVDVWAATVRIGESRVMHIRAMRPISVRKRTMW